HALPPRRREQSLHVDRRLRMEGEDRCPGGHERLEVALGLDHHQMHVDGFVGEPPQRRDHVGPEREVRHETPVHHVHMQPVGAPPPPPPFPPPPPYAGPRPPHAPRRRATPPPSPPSPRCPRPAPVP